MPHLLTASSELVSLNEVALLDLRRMWFVGVGICVRLCVIACAGHAVE